MYLLTEVLEYYVLLCYDIVSSDVRTLLRRGRPGERRRATGGSGAGRMRRPPARTAFHPENPQHRALWLSKIICPLLTLQTAFLTSILQDYNVGYITRNHALTYGMI